MKTFYPGVTDIGQARMVSIRGGEDMGGMDIGIRGAQTFKVSGQISSLLPPPAPPQLGAPGVNGAVLMLLNRDPAAPDDGGTRAAGTVPLLPTTGQFELANVLPGAYELFARVSIRSSVAADRDRPLPGAVRPRIGNCAITTSSKTFIRSSKKRRSPRNSGGERSRQDSRTHVSRFCLAMQR